jgi:hypothetical protein
VLFYTRDNVCPLLLIVFRLKRSLRRALLLQGLTKYAARGASCFTGLVRCDAEL